jgi:predicted MFS family arabinose efflux permease
MDWSEMTSLWRDLSPAVRRAVRIDISVTLLFTVFAGLTTPFIGLILRRELGASPFQLSALGSASAACLLLSLALARVVDSRRPLPWVVWPTFVARALFLFVPFIETPWPFVGVLVGGTLLGTLVTPAQTALVQQVYPEPERGRALGSVRMVGAIVAIALAAVAGQLLGWLSWRWVFPAAAVVGMAASLRARRLPVPDTDPEPIGDRPGLADAWRAVRDDHGYRRLLLSAFVFGSGVWLMQPATPMLLADVVGATTAQVGLLSGVGAVAAIAGNFVWGRLVDKSRSVRALRVVYLVGMLAPATYSFCADFPSLVVGAAVAESLMATGLDLVWMLAVIEFAGPGRTAQYAAIASTLAGIRGLVAPMLGAMVIETLGLQALYFASAALMGAGAILIGCQARTVVEAVHQNTPRYIEQPRHTEGGRSVQRAARNAS